MDLSGRGGATIPLSRACLFFPVPFGDLELTDFFFLLCHDWTVGWLVGGDFEKKNGWMCYG